MDCLKPTITLQKSMHALEGAGVTVDSKTQVAM
jgi:hypothetical protein